ncbi:penicillin-binding transpeptidase domain-containing protein [Bacillus sp. SCS-153A]|uniref:penicillin-binding transpeptidase domain-containing protein n=1 Tax=Rossellomorea sedimentorum TaxID=3115294 RepID=UPI0039068DEC
MSVLHLASTYGAILNDGIMIQPLLLANADKEMWEKDMLSTENAELSKAGLRKGVTEGIAGKAAIEGKSNSGKNWDSGNQTKQGTTGTENGFFVS